MSASVWVRAEETWVTRTYDVEQTVELREIPAHAEDVCMWVSIPDDDPAQRVLEWNVVSAPGDWRLVREKDYGNRFLYLKSTKPETNTLAVTVNFVVRREPIIHDLSQVQTSRVLEKGLFEDDLRTDAPHMEVTDDVRDISSKVCGKETNVVVQARKLLNYVAENADHYSKDATKPKCGIGDAADCLTQGGGCCTDLHSLFIALARARGIPARLQMGYRLQPKNAGIVADPGYRCWPEYFVSGHGWVPADIVEADAAAAKTRDRWLSGLNERRVHLNQGRHFDLPLRKNPARVNTMIIGYAEIDGVPARVLPEGDKQPQLFRTVRYREVKAPIDG